MAIEIQEHDRLVTIVGDGGVSLTVRRHRTILDVNKFRTTLVLYSRIGQAIADELYYDKEDLDYLISSYLYVGSAYYGKENLGFEFLSSYDTPEAAKAKIIGYIEVSTANSQIDGIIGYAISLVDDKAPFGVNEVTSPPQEVDGALLADPKSPAPAKSTKTKS